MKIIALTFTTHHFDYIVLSGTKSTPLINTKGRITLPANHNVPQTVGWFENELGLLLNSTKPDSVFYKLTINNVNHNYVHNVFYGQSILNLLCNKKSIEISHVSPSSLSTGKFDLAKGTNLISHVDNLFGKQTSPWDKTMKDTVLIALLNLPS